MQNDKAPQIMVRLEPRPLCFLWLHHTALTAHGQVHESLHREDRIMLVSMLLTLHTAVRMAGNKERVWERR